MRSRSRSTKLAALLVLLLGVAGCSDDGGPTADTGPGPDTAGPVDGQTDSPAQPDQAAGGDAGPPAGLDDLEYLGAFRLKGLDEGNDKRLGYSEGVIALDGQGSLWVASHTYTDLFAPFKIPQTLGSDLTSAPVVDQSSSWVDLTQGVQAQISGDRNVRGLLRVGSGWLYTVQEYYNGDASHDPALGYDGSGLWTTTHHSQATAGYVAEIHADWTTKLGARFIAGLAGTPIHQPASHGPVAHAFTVDPASLPGAQATVTTERLAFYPLGEAHPDFTDVSTIRGAAFTKKAVYFFGRKGLGVHWYGLPTDGGPGVTDACSSSKGYHAEKRTSWVWVVDPAELELVKTQGASSKVPTLFSGSMDALLKLTGDCTAILGASLDHATGRLYISTDDPQSTGEPQPAIHVLRVKTHP